MKKLFLLTAISFSVIACKEEPPKDYATLSGKIENAGENKTITVLNRKGFNKAIDLADDGTFKDTLKVEEGRFYFQIGKQSGAIYLKNDNESSITVNAEDFIPTLKFAGDDAVRNNFITDYGRIQQKYINDELFEGDANADTGMAFVCPEF